MAFPYEITVNGLSIPKEQLKAIDLQNLRQAFIDSFLFAQPQFPGNGRGRISEQLSQIARVLGRSAGNEPTVYDNGAAPTSASRTASSLSLQVERALTQVLGRAPGRGADGFVSALNSAFPSGTDGRIMTTPARSVVSLYSPITEGLTGQLSVEQANLYRQASIIGSDALKVLDGIQPFIPTADIDAVEALKALIRSQIRSLLDEFGRLDEPRKQRVESLLNTLLVTEPVGRGKKRRIVGGSLFQLGKMARLIKRPTGSEGGESGENSDGDFDDEPIMPVTIDDEGQIANFTLLVNYVETLQTIWRKFDDDSTIVDQVTGNYSERLSRVSVMLPVVADSNISFMSALDSIGFTESERRSDAALFTTLLSPLPFDLGQVVIFDVLSRVQITVTLPSMTLNDFDEWIDRFTNLEAPALLSSSGQFGLNFVTDQADTLFWTIAAVLSAVTPTTDPTTPQHRNQLRLLGKVLSFERVQQTLSELVFQLDTLADLGVGSIPSLA